MEASDHLKEAIQQILNEIQKMFKEKSSGESETKDLVQKIEDEIKKSDVKALVILKQQLGNVLTDMEKLDTESSNKASKVRFFFRCSSSKNRLNDTQKDKVMEDLEGIKDKAKYLNGERKELIVGESEKDLELVGREKEKEEIIDQLSLLRRGGNEASPPVPVIIIAGLAGIGKTKLTRHVCEDEKVKKQVGLPAWVSGADYDSFDADSIARQVIGSVVTATTPSPTTENLNIIAILDDWRVEIGDAEVKALQDKLKEAGLCVTAIMITTRSCLVVRKIATSPVKSYALPGLNENESASLLEKTPGRGACDNSTITKIVRQCRGVPRAIIMTMAKLLQSPGSRLTELTEHFLSELVCSYYDEGFPHLCFAYCSLFPQDYLFDAERLIHLWMAEGFLNPSNPSTSSGSEPDPEETGHGYLRELVGRSIFQVVEEDEFGRVRSCKMHPLMHEMARFVADGENITVDPNGHNVHQQVQRASFDLSLLDFPRGIPAPLFDKAEQVRTILFFPRRQSRRLPLQMEISRPVLNKIFKSFKRLRVLDLRDLEIAEVPSSIGELEDLKYLDLSQNNMEKLPSSIAKLSKLETLKLSRCYLLKELPKEFKNLAKLKHLDMEGCMGLTRMPRKMSKLSSLQTLSGFVANKNDPMGGLEELAKLNELRGHLEILYLDRVLQSLENRGTKYLEGKQHLQRLTLKWDLGVDQEEGQRHLSLLNCLEPHPNLGALILVGYQGPMLSSWPTSIQFTCLVKLSLKACPGCKYFPEQDQLPELKILELVRLDNLEYIAQNCDKEAAFYKTLEELTISDCPKLISWWQTEKEVNDRPVFASISKLHVRHCPLLTCMPLYPRLDMILEGSSRFGKELVLEGSSSLKLLLDTRSTGSSSVNYFIPLEKLHIQNCNHLENLSDAFQHLSSLQRLTIESCEKINLDGDGYRYDYSNQWEGLRSLLFLTIREIPMLRSLSFGDSVTTLRELGLHNCHGLTFISDSIGKLTSLRRLEISKCNKLMSLPIAMKDLYSLQTLLILDCHWLLPRCQRDTGDDWPQISHIKHIQVK